MAYLRWQRSQLGAPKAFPAAVHKLARIVERLMRFGEAYATQAEAEYAEQVCERLEKQFLRRAKEPGFYARKKAEPTDAAAARQQPG